MDVLVKRPDFHTFDYFGTYFYRFNVTRKPFDDPRVRQAFALATDKDRLIRKLTNGLQKRADHFVPAGVANYDPPRAPSFAPERARELLAAAGYPGGSGFPKFEYAYFATAGGGSQLQGKIGVELQQMWQETLGIACDLRQIERKIFLNAQSRLDYDISASSWVGDYNDPNTFLDMFLSASGNNRTGWKSTRYDQLIHDANRQPDLKLRAALFREAETLLIAGDVPIVPIYFYSGFNYFDPDKIEGLYQNLLDEHPLQSIRVKRPPAVRTRIEDDQRTSADIPVRPALQPIPVNSCGQECPRSAPRFSALVQDRRRKSRVTGRCRAWSRQRLFWRFSLWTRLCPAPDLRPEKSPPW